MRDFLDAIFDFIGSESLTDEEFDSLSVTVEEYTKEVYEALKGILEAREGVSGQGKRLKLYFVAKGVDLIGVPSITPNSNIFLGGVAE